MTSTITQSDLPVITKFRTLREGRSLHYEVNEDLSVMLAKGGLDVCCEPTVTRYVLVSLDVDDEPCDVVTVSYAAGDLYLETLDQAIATLQGVRAGLLS